MDDTHSENTYVKDGGRFIIFTHLSHSKTQIIHTVSKIVEVADSDIMFFCLKTLLTFLVRLENHQVADDIISGFNCLC